MDRSCCSNESSICFFRSMSLLVMMHRRESKERAHTQGGKGGRKREAPSRRGSVAHVGNGKVPFRMLLEGGPQQVLLGQGGLVIDAQEAAEAALAVGIGPDEGRVAGAVGVSRLQPRVPALLLVVLAPHRADRLVRAGRCVQGHRRVHEGHPKVPLIWARPGVHLPVALPARHGSARRAVQPPHPLLRAPRGEGIGQRSVHPSQESPPCTRRRGAPATGEGSRGPSACAAKRAGSRRGPSCRTSRIGQRHPPHRISQPAPTRTRRTALASPAARQRDTLEGGSPPAALPDGKQWRKRAATEREACGHEQEPPRAAG